MKRNQWGILVAGACAGSVNGLLGAGGGMVLVPLLSGLAKLDEEQIFPTSVAIILPISIVSLFGSRGLSDLDCGTALPYLIGSAVGGILCGLLGKKIPVKWLHRLLGVLILWGGIRYLC